MPGRDVVGTGVLYLRWRWRDGEKREGGETERRGKVERQKRKGGEIKRAGGSFRFISQVEREIRRDKKREKRNAGRLREGERRGKVER